MIDAIRNVQPPETWRCVVTDQSSHRILMNVMDEHDILNERATGTPSTLDGDGHEKGIAKARVRMRREVLRYKFAFALN